MNIKTRINKVFASSLAIAFATVLVCGIPAQARSDYDNWQPDRGQIHKQENCLEKQLNRAYNNGMIDTNEMAQMRRDLDGIKIQEDEFRVDHNGLGPNDVKCVDAKLDRFQQNLYKAEADKVMDQEPAQVAQRRHNQQMNNNNQCQNAAQNQQANNKEANCQNRNQ